MRTPAPNPYGLGLRLALLAVLGISACASSPGNSRSGDLVGCFYFQQDTTGEIRLPWGIRLLPDSLQGFPAMASYEGVRQAATLTPEGDADHPFGHWRPLAGDSIHVGYPGGGGISLRLATRPDTLSGTARGVGDAAPVNGTLDRQQHPVTLTRARCPEES